MDYPYGQFGVKHLEAIEPGLTLFNAQKYWECHEDLEHLWLEDRQDHARYIYWAVIQVAAACIHFREKNLIGAIGLWKKSKEKFQKAEGLKVETPLVHEFLDWAKLKSLVFAIPENPELSDFAGLFEFRFTSYFDKKKERETLYARPS